MVWQFFDRFYCVCVRHFIWNDFYQVICFIQTWYWIEQISCKKLFTLFPEKLWIVYILVCIWNPIFPILSNNWEKIHFHFRQSWVNWIIIYYYIIIGFIIIIIIVGLESGPTGKKSHGTVPFFHLWPEIY